MEKLDVFIRWFIPNASSLSEEDFRVHQQFVYTAFITSIFAFMYVPMDIYIGGYHDMVTVAIAGSIFMLLPFFLRVGVYVSGLSNVYVAVIAICLCFFIYFQGGIRVALCTPWSVMLPAMAMLLQGTRSSIFWWIVALVILGVNVALYKDGFAPPVRYDFSKDWIFTALSFGGLISIFFFITYIFHKGKNEALEKIEVKNHLLAEEIKRSDDLLLNILPTEIVEELKATGKTQAQSYDLVSVLFADIKDFTSLSTDMQPVSLISTIDIYFEAFDKIIDKHGIEKIKTIGDAYVCAGGLPMPDSDNPLRTVHAAKEFLQVVDKMNEQFRQEGKPYFEFRVGIHSGPIVAGVVGIKKFSYDIWGDTVNTAARMEQNSEAGKINVSEETYQLVKNEFKFSYRGEIEAKGKGHVKMYFVD